MFKPNTFESHFLGLGWIYVITGLMIALITMIVAGISALTPDFPPGVLGVVFVLVIAFGTEIKCGVGLLSKKPWARSVALGFGGFLLLVGVVSLFEVKIFPAVVELTLGAYSLWVMLRPGAAEAWLKYAPKTDPSVTSV